MEKSIINLQWLRLVIKQSMLAPQVQGDWRFQDLAGDLVGIIECSIKHAKYEMQLALDEAMDEMARGVS